MDNNIISNLISGLIGAGSALTVFYLQSRHDKKIDQQKQEEKDSSTIEYLKVSLQKTHHTIKEYIIILKKFDSDIKTDPVKFPNNDYLLFPYAERLAKKVDQNDVFFALRNRFSKQDAIKHYSIIYSVVDYIVSALPEIYKIQDRAIEQDIVRKTQYKLIVDKNIDEIGKMGIIRGSSFGPNFREDISELLKTLYEGRIDNTDLQYYQENFVDKLKMYILKNYQTNRELFEIVMELRKATQVLESVKQHNLHHSKTIQRYLKQFQESDDNLYKVVSALN